MTPERLLQIETIYHGALDLQPAARRPFLDRACGADDELRREVESLLEFGPGETCLDQDAIQFAAESVAAEENGTLIGHVLGRYQLLSLAGRGGMGDVYCAVDRRLNRLVAIKVIPSPASANSRSSQRFEREARASAALSHPHICRLYDVGRDAGMDYLVFEYLFGDLLSERLENGALPFADALNYAIQMADAVASAHEHGITHRDLKPRNVMLTKSGLKLLDFGIAQLRYPDEPAPTGSAASTPAGSLAYMAPEQIRNHETDPRTDIFGFGLVAYQMFTGRPAFQGATRDTLLSSILNDDPPPVSRFAPEAPPALGFVIARCLAKDPLERWQSIRDVLFMLKSMT
jgi:serine/threonine protein kinase